MMKNNVVELNGLYEIVDPLTELLRAGAEQLNYQAVESEFSKLLTQHAGEQAEDGKAAVTLARAGTVNG